MPSPGKDAPQRRGVARKRMAGRRFAPTMDVCLRDWWRSALGRAKSTESVLALARQSEATRAAVADGDGYGHMVRAGRCVAERRCRAVRGRQVMTRDLVRDGMWLIAGSVQQCVDIWPMTLLESRFADMPPWKRTDGAAVSSGKMLYGRRCSVWPEMRSE